MQEIEERITKTIELLELLLNNIDIPPKTREIMLEKLNRLR